jgi:hypothetical protein
MMLGGGRELASLPGVQMIEWARQIRRSEQFQPDVAVGRFILERPREALPIPSEN